MKDIYPIFKEGLHEYLMIMGFIMPSDLNKPFQYRGKVGVFSALLDLSFMRGKKYRYRNHKNLIDLSTESNA